MEKINKTLLLSGIGFFTSIVVLFVATGSQLSGIFLFYLGLGSMMFLVIPLTLLRTKLDYKKLNKILKERKKNPTLPKGFQAKKTLNGENIDN